MRSPYGWDVGIDWLKMTGPINARERVGRVIERLTGWRVADLRPCRGGKWYRSGARWEAGPMLAWDHPSAPWSMMVDLPGAVCAKLGTAVLLEVARELRALGFRARRVDLRSDVRALGDAELHLLDDMMAGCRAGELVGFRDTWKIFDGPKSRGLTMGNRGSTGSGKHVRVYDKGLETGTEGPRSWERVEAEFADEHADRALGLLLDHAAGHDEVIARMIWCGAVFDFLEVLTDASGRMVQRSRRPRSEWWMYWVSDAEVKRFTVPRRLSTLAGRMRWLARAVMPAVDRLAAAAGMSHGEVLAVAAEEEGSLFSGTPEPDGAALEFAEWLVVRRAQRAESAC